MDNYASMQTYMKLILEVAEDGEDSHFQVICQGAHPEYKGGNHCAYNAARAISDTVAMLKRSVSQRPEDWIYRNLHARSYKNMPWSLTPLKFFFHREVPYGGNKNTVNVSSLNMEANMDNIVLKSGHVAGLKYVTEFRDSEGNPQNDVNLWSIDTGINGNPFQGHYFDMNHDHNYGRLRQMKVGRQLEGTPTSKLIIRRDPAAQARMETDEDDEL